MADPLLTTLCTICHIAPPRYKCPRCGLQTCSVPCIRKHKARASCPGTRDPTAYVARPDLRTARGVDHDYNFLHGLEVSLQRAERELVEDRGVVRRDELRPPTVTDVSWRTGRDGRKRKVVTTRVLREVKGRTLEKYLAHRLRRLNIRMICLPAGMERRVENRTTLHRRTQCINWQVEWLALDKDAASPAEPSRTLAKTLDNEPLYWAYYAATHQQDPQSRRQTRSIWHGAQNSYDSTWFVGTTAVAQELQTGRWLTQDPGNLPELWPVELDAQLIAKWDFYLASPRQRSDQPIKVTAVGAHETLQDVLSNTNVLEFPTIYVLEKGKPLPEGFALGPKDTSFNPPKRKGGPGARRDEPGPKRRKQIGGPRRPDQDLEDGEIDDGDEEPDDNRQEDGTYVGALEAGEVVEEHSYGEESDDNVEEAADTTSSSGSDSEDE